MGASRRTPVGLDEADHLQRRCALLVEQLRLVQARLDGPVYGSLLKGLRRDVVVIALATILAMGTPPSVGTKGGEGPCRVAPQRGNQVQVVLPRPLQGVVVAAGPVQPQGGPRHTPSDPWP